MNLGKSLIEPGTTSTGQPQVQTAAVPQRKGRLIPLKLRVWSAGPSLLCAVDLLRLVLRSADVVIMGIGA